MTLLLGRTRRLFVFQSAGTILFHGAACFHAATRRRSEIERVACAWRTALGQGQAQKFLPSPL